MEPNYKRDARVQNDGDSWQKRDDRVYDHGEVNARDRSLKTSKPTYKREHGYGNGGVKYRRDAREYSGPSANYKREPEAHQYSSPSGNYRRDSNEADVVR